MICHNLSTQRENINKIYMQSDILALNLKYSKSRFSAQNSSSFLIFNRLNFASSKV